MSDDELVAWLQKHAMRDPEYSWQLERAATRLAALLADCDDERQRADEAEAWCARLASDRECELALRGMERAAALADLREVRVAFGRDWDDPYNSNPAEIALDALHAAIEARGEAETPPHERTLAENRRLRAALEQIAGSVYGDVIKAPEIAREALKEAGHAVS